MQSHREKAKKVLTSPMVPSSAKSRDLSIPPGLDLHTPVGPELAEQTCPKSLMWGLLLCCRNFIISTELPACLPLPVDQQVHSISKR